jgi:hypothetical protein
MLGEPQCPSRPRGRHGGQAFRKHLARACRMVTEKLPHPQLEASRIGAPRQIGDGPWIPAVDPWGLHVAERAGDTDLGRSHVQRELGGRVLHVPRFQGQRCPIRQEVGKESENGCRNESGFLLHAIGSTGNTGSVPRRPALRSVTQCLGYSV